MDENDVKELIDCLELLENAKSSNQSQDIKPRFKVGDVVYSFNEKYEKDLSYQYFIKEAVFVDNGNKPSEYIYEVGMIDNPDKSYTFKEDDLVLEYHDTNWAEYVTESVGNSLPAWRGELYNIYIINDNIESSKDLINEYNNHTIPPAYMEHILDSHYIINRAEWLIENSKNPNKDQNRELIRKKLNIDENALSALRLSLRKKIKLLNLADTDIIHPGRMARKSGVKFTNQEFQFAKIICDLDEEKDHYKLDMTCLEIMDAIKEAYSNAYKTGHSYKGQINKDKRTGEKIPPIKGNLLYRGKSDKYSMLIEFQYDRDLKLIDSAYPVDDDSNDINKNHPNE